MRYFLRLVFLALLVSCAHTPPAPDGALEAGGLDRLYCVEHDGAGRCSIYRSAQPTRAQFEVLRARYGIRSVIKLNTRWPLDGGSDALPPGVELYHHPWWPAGPVSDDAVRETLDDLAQADKPALIHCLHGEDRTGLLVGLWRLRGGTARFAAWGEMIAYGFHPELIELKAAFDGSFR